MKKAVAAVAAAATLAAGVLVASRASDRVCAVRDASGAEVELGRNLTSPQCLKASVAWQQQRQSPDAGR